MKKEEIEAIKRRCGAATPGPWKVEEQKERDPRTDTWHHLYWIVRPHDSYDPDITCERKQDADFFSHARTDVPALVAEVEKLRALVRKHCDIHGVYIGDGPAALRARIYHLLLLSIIKAAIQMLRKSGFVVSIVKEVGRK
jgi:hypothetical protein